MSGKSKAGKLGFSFYAAVAGGLALLKLTGTLHWPWLWVLAPLWAPFAILVVFLFGFFALVGFSASKGKP